MIESTKDLLQYPKTEVEALLNRLRQIPQQLDEHISWLARKVSYTLKTELDLSQHRNTNCFHSSELAYYLECPRRGWYSLHGAKRDALEPKSIRIFNTGSGVHNQFQLYLQDVHERMVSPELEEKDRPALRLVEYESEVPFFSEELLLSGHCDGLCYIDDPVMGWVRCVWEIKSMNRANWDKHLRVVMPKHFVQASSYAEFLSAPIVLFAYINKDTSDLTIHPWIYEDSYWKKATTLIQEIRTMKDPPSRSVSHACKDCPFSTTCSPGDLTRRTLTARR